MSNNIIPIDTKFIPPGAESLEHIKGEAFRVGLQGAPGTGKTYASTTFPNPIILDFDNALHCHYGSKDIMRIPFWDGDWVVNKMEWLTSDKTKKVGIPLKKHGIPDKREALKQWLKSYVSQFTKEQTLVLDSWTFLQDAFDTVTWAEPVYTKKGEIDEYAPWDLKIEYSKEIIGLLKAARCNVVVLFHEMQQRDKESGALLDKVQPLMRGQFVAQIKGHFPFFFRTLAPNDNRKLLPLEYVWQTTPSPDFDPKCSYLKLKEQKLVPANYQSLLKYA